MLETGQDLPFDRLFAFRIFWDLIPSNLSFNCTVGNRIAKTSLIFLAHYFSGNRIYPNDSLCAIKILITIQATLGEPSRCRMRQWERIIDEKLVAAVRLIIMPLPTCRIIAWYGLFLSVSYLWSILCHCNIQYIF